MRRTLLRAGPVVIAAAAVSAGSCASRAAPGTESADEGHYRALEDKIRTGMAAYGIPGVAIGILYRGAEYVRGFGVTDVDHSTPVDGDTLFAIGSTTKTFTGTTVMRLVEQRLLDLDDPVDRYLPEFRTADPAVASRVTVRQLLNHSAGWLGDDFQDFGSGDDALARYAQSMVRLPQLTPPGEVFAYNNAAVALAGRLVEVITGKPYEQAVRELLIDPLGLARTRFSAKELTGFNVAASHKVVEGTPRVESSPFTVPRTVNPAGGLLSSVRDQLRYARFHLGDGTAPGGQRLLTERSLVALRSRPGPGGTMLVELDGVGVTWLLRPSAEGVQIVQHGGSLPGQYSGFLMVPDREFALTMLTNSTGGPKLVGELFTDDWALRRFAAVRNLSAVPKTLNAGELAPYEGHYTRQVIGTTGAVESIDVQLSAEGSQLRMKSTSGNDIPESHLAFYGRDHVVILDANSALTQMRADFVRGPEGTIQWLRLGGRLHRRQQ
ncbi:MAG: serine hydrolase domain-containing protein [Pseudonocardiaceae bacterium]